MKLSKIIKNLLIDTGLRSDKYTDERRIEEVNQALNQYIEYATQQGHTFDFQSVQEVTVTADEESFDISRDIKHANLLRIEYLGENGDEDPICLKKTPECTKNRCTISVGVSNTTYKVSDTEIRLTDAVKGVYRIYYERNNLPVLTVANLNDEIEYFSDTFIPLLWLQPALKNVGFYDPNRYSVLRNEYEKLHILFRNHYYRKSTRRKRVVFGKRKSNKNNL